MALSAFTHYQVIDQVGAFVIPVAPCQLTKPLARIDLTCGSGEGFGGAWSDYYFYARVNKERTYMAKEPRYNVELRGVVYQEGKFWIAHCLELDLVVEGPSSSEALKDLMDLSRLQIEVAMKEGDLQSIFRPAPSNIWALYFMGTNRALPKKPVKPLKGFEARELAVA